MSELKPCPFCGGEAEAHEVTFPYHYWDVLCDGECFNHFCEKPTKAEAIDAWNTQAEQTCMLIRHGSLANMPSFVCWSCSECGFGWHHSENDRQFSYCPNCGAMVVEQ